MDVVEWLTAQCALELTLLTYFSRYGVVMSGLPVCIHLRTNAVNMFPLPWNRQTYCLLIMYVWLFMHVSVKTLL